MPLLRTVENGTGRGVGYLLLRVHFGPLEKLSERFKIRHGHSQILYMSCRILEDTRAGLDETCATTEFLTRDIPRQPYVTPLLRADQISFLMSSAADSDPCGRAVFRMDVR